MRRYVNLTRNQLLGLLALGTSPAHAECYEAVRRGTAFRLHPDTVTREGALRIYGMRAQVAALDRTETVGIEEALKDLAATPHERLRIGAVSADHEFMLFLDPECHELIACLGVEGRTAR